MLKEAMEKLLSLGAPTVKEYEERTYSDRKLEPIMRPLDSAEGVMTLTGLVDLMNAKVNEMNWDELYIHIESPKRVTVSEVTCDKWGRRQTHISCDLPDYGKFRFGDYMGQEAFIISLQAFFDREKSVDMDEILTIASKLKAEAVSDADDNGIAQSVTLRKGVVMAEKATIKRIVKLRPYRTFREIEQPESSFIFRLKTNAGETPSLALFAADADMWQAEAMQSIKAFLRQFITSAQIVA